MMRRRRGLLAASLCLASPAYAGTMEGAFLVLGPAVTVVVAAPALLAAFTAAQGHRLRTFLCFFVLQWVLTVASCTLGSGAGRLRDASVERNFWAFWAATLSAVVVWRALQVVLGARSLRSLAPGQKANPARHPPSPPTAHVPTRPASCPNCGADTTTTATNCTACNACFEGDGAWKPVPR